ncbi:MAG: hypothetical protein Q8L65_12545, partial [Burkholderiales bacterium]|nr:hypothetical protein [Burkholderiales bacterium]
RSLSRRERDAKPFSRRDKGTLEAEQKGGDEGEVSRSYVILNRTIQVVVSGGGAARKLLQTERR